MNSFLVSENGEKLCIDEDLFDAMWNSIESNDEVMSQRKLKKKAHNDRLNAKYREEGYFKNYFKNNSHEYECERCGSMLSTNTIRSKHYKSVKCQRLSEEKRQAELGERIVRKVLFG